MADPAAGIMLIYNGAEASESTKSLAIMFSMKHHKNRWSEMHIIFLIRLLDVL